MLSRPLGFFVSFLLAASVRLAFVELVAKDWAVVLDQKAYSILAKKILEGKPYAIPNSPVRARDLADTTLPTAVYPPGYPLFLAACYKSFGENPQWPRRLNALLWGLAAGLLFLLALEAGLSAWAALAGAAVLALSPPHINLAGLLLTENLFTPLLYGAVLSVLLALKDWRWAFLGGVLLSAAAAVRPSSLLLAPVMAGLLLWRKRPLGAALLVLGWLPFPTAWGLRNLRALGKFIPASTAGGRALYFTVSFTREGDDPDSLKAFLKRKGVEPRPGSFNEAQIDELYREMALETFKRRPWQVFVNLALNPIRHLFNLPYFHKPPSWRTIAYALFTLGVLVLAAVGFRATPGPAKWLYIAPLLYFLTFHTILSPSLVRYSLPTVPLLYPLAAEGVRVLRRSKG